MKIFRKKEIDEWALDYWLLQVYAKLSYRIYYRKIEVINRQNLPLHQPVILAPNHQNALMDALTLVCNTPFQIVFLARADIFKGKRMIRFLTFANIMPIYRQRDGIENVKKNDEVFEKTVKVLNKKRYPLGLFAEGNHGDRRRLRPLVKGLFRIAFLAQEEYGNQPAVKIVPIGFDYGHYQNFRSTLFVNIGEPIEVSELIGEFRNNPAVAINELKERFAKALSRQMIDIQTEEYYDLYMRLREVYNDCMREKLGIKEANLGARFKADKKMIEKLDQELQDNPEHIKLLNESMQKYQSGLKNAGLRDWVIKKGKFSFTGIFWHLIFHILAWPVFVFGWLNNGLPYLFTASRTQNIKDPQFHSSFKFVIGMIVFPLWYIFLAVILAFISIPLWIKVSYIILLPFSGLAAFHYFIGLKKFGAKWRFTWYRNSTMISELVHERNSIINTMDQIMDKRKADHEN